MKQAMKDYWQKYADFLGKSSRRDYWLTILGHFIILAILSILIGGFSLLASSVLPDFYTAIARWLMSIEALYLLIMIVPCLALQTRRLRDAGLHWSLMLILFAPLMGIVALMILSILPGLPFEEEEIATKQPKIMQSGKISFMQGIKDYFRGYADFRGQTTRSGFWWTQLIFWAAIIVLSLQFEIAYQLDLLFFENFGPLSVLSLALLTIFLLGFLIPQLAITFRRFHDIGMKNGKIVAILSILTAIMLFNLSLHQVAKQSYVIHQFDLAFYLIFIVIILGILGLIYLLVMETDELNKISEEE